MTADEKRQNGPLRPHLVWMVVFIAVPLAIVVYFAFTDKAGHFTLENIMGLGAYTTVFARSIVLAVIATVICLVIAFPIGYMLSRMGPQPENDADAHYAAHVDEFSAAHLCVDDAFGKQRPYQPLSGAVRHWAAAT